jgi:hypothetical protein
VGLRSRPVSSAFGVSLGESDRKLLAARGPAFFPSPHRQRLNRYDRCVPVIRPNVYVARAAQSLVPAVPLPGSGERAGTNVPRDKGCPEVVSTPCYRRTNAAGARPASSAAALQWGQSADWRAKDASAL